jgi:DNA-binding response OmpR family regulator
MKVLVVEDSPVIRQGLATGLRRSGFAVDVAGDGAEGLWRAESNTYDVIVLDIMLPKLDGWALLERIRARGDKTAVLILTAKDAVDDRVRGFDSGAQDYLIKPFAFEELLARVRSLCGRSFGLESKLARCGELIVDLSARRVMLGGRELDLARREFMLLEYILLRSGQVVSRTEVEAHLYDDANEITSNAVDATFARLRRKLEEFDDAPVIRTVRGMGWVLEQPAR